MSGWDFSFWVVVWFTFWPITLLVVYVAGRAIDALIDWYVEKRWPSVGGKHQR